MTPAQKELVIARIARDKAERAFGETLHLHDQYKATAQDVAKARTVYHNAILRERKAEKGITR